MLFFRPFESVKPYVFCCLSVHMDTTLCQLKIVAHSLLLRSPVWIASRPPLLPLTHDETGVRHKSDTGGDNRDHPCN